MLKKPCKRIFDAHYLTDWG